MQRTAVPALTTVHAMSSGSQARRDTNVTPATRPTGAKRDRETVRWQCGRNPAAAARVAVDRRRCEGARCLPKKHREVDRARADPRAAAARRRLEPARAGAIREA